MVRWTCFKTTRTESEAGMAKAWSLFFLRISLGWLMVIWGANRIFNVEHSIKLANNYYSGFLAMESLLPIVGILQVAFGLIIIVGLARRWAYPLLLLVNGVSLVAVFPSIIDPWGWILEGTNVFFYPSLIIFASAMLLVAFQDQDSFSLDAKRSVKQKSWIASRCSK